MMKLYMTKQVFLKITKVFRVEIKNSVGFYCVIPM